MATPIFTNQSDTDTTGEITFSVLRAKFGDGYEQVSANGINNKKQNWPLSFTRPQLEANQIMSFLDERAGGKSFLWTPPLGVQGVYRCVKYNLKAMDLLNFVVTATFEQA